MKVFRCWVNDAHFSINTVMSKVYPVNTPPGMQKVFDKFCEPRSLGLPGGDIVLMTTRVDRWEMRRDTISGDHEAGMSMWSTPFQGGIDIARHILSHPEDFAGKTVLDIGAGSGLIAIAAAKAGAAAIAIDSSRMACWAMDTNAALNSVELKIGNGNIVDPECWIEIDDNIASYKELAAKADIITAGDIFYDGYLSKAVADTLAGFSRSGKIILASSGEEDMNHYFFGENVEALGHSYNKRASFVKFQGPVFSPSDKPVQPRYKRHRSLGDSWDYS